MVINERSIGDVTVIDIEGRITVQEGADELREVIHNLIREGRLKFVLNMAAVPYIDSTALGRIVRSYTTAMRLGGTLKLLNVTARVQQLLVITKLLSVFDLFDDEGEAVRSFGKPHQTA